MGPESMPAEAGIVERAVDFEKGCYIGQEPVARLHYRGKPNRRLRGLRLSAPAAHGDPLFLGDREVGTIGSSCLSPAHGPIALAIVRREAADGERLAVGGGGATAELVELPFSSLTSAAGCRSVRLDSSANAAEEGQSVARRSRPVGSPGGGRMRRQRLQERPPSAESPRR